MAGTTGLEPATSAVTGQRSNQLSYVPTLRLNLFITGRREEMPLSLQTRGVGSCLWMQLILVTLA